MTNNLIQGLFKDFCVDYDSTCSPETHLNQNEVELLKKLSTEHLLRVLVFLGKGFSSSAAIDLNPESRKLLDENLKTIEVLMDTLTFIIRTGIDFTFDPKSLVDFNPTNDNSKTVH